MQYFSGEKLTDLSSSKSKKKMRRDILRNLSKIGEEISESIISPSSTHASLMGSISTTSSPKINETNLNETIRERRIKRKRRQKKLREIKQTKIPRRMEKVREIRLGHLLETITVYNNQMYRKKESDYMA